jgi:hypothetical protein
VLRSRSFIVLLVVAAVVLVVAFRVAPATLAGGGYGGFNDAAPLTHALGVHLIAYWNSGNSALTPEMVDLVDYWRRWHVAKIVISVLLTVVLALLATALWNRFLNAGTSRSMTVGYAVTAAVISVLALCGVAVLVANVQSTAAPLSALLGLLPVGPSGGELGQMLNQIRQGLADPASPYAGRPALAVMVSSHSRYLWTLAVAASVVAVGMAGAGAYAWRAFFDIYRTDVRRRYTALGFGSTAMIVAAAVLVAVAASARSALEPAGALLEFFNGG